MINDNLIPLGELAKNSKVQISAEGKCAVAVVLIVTAGACFIVDRVLNYKQKCIAGTNDSVIRTK